jgi:hypothetical protein
MTNRIFWSCLLLAGTAYGEIQTQHAFDSSIRFRWFEPLWHTRIRTKPTGGGLFQLRTGPIFQVNLTDRVILIGGYYYTREENDDGWRTTSRPFGGAEVSWGKPVEVEWRGLLERFAVSRDPDYFRLRNRVRISPPGRIAPYVGAELFVDAHGVRSVRYSVGLRRELREDFVIDFGYFFEDRRPMPAGERHMFGTSFHWRNKSRRVDPDF